MTSQSLHFGQLSIAHSREGIIKSITKICVRTESLSVCYIYLKVQKGHNSISSWCSATKPGVSRPHMQVHIPENPPIKSKNPLPRYASGWKGCGRTDNAKTMPPLKSFGKG